MYVPMPILWIAMILIILLIIVAAGVLYKMIKTRREIEGKYNDLIYDQRTLLGGLWAKQCQLPMASWQEFVRGLNLNLMHTVQHGDREASELALRILLCGADIPTVVQLRNTVPTTHLLRLLHAVAPRIKEYHHASRTGPVWSADDAIYGVITVIRGARPVIAIADPCTPKELADGAAWLNSKE